MPATTAQEVQQHYFLAHTALVACGCLLIVWVALRWRRRGELPFLRLWALSWVAYLLARTVILLRMSSVLEGCGSLVDGVTAGFAEACYYLHVVLLLWCIAVQVGRVAARPSLRLLAGLALALFAFATLVAWITSDASQALRVLARGGLRHSVSAVGFLLGGFVLLRQGFRIGRFGAQLTAAALWVGAITSAVHVVMFCTGRWLGAATYTGTFEVLVVCAIGLGIVMWLQEDAAAATARMEAELGERTTALLQAQRLESIGQLAGGVAHDFNNVLTVVIGNAEALQREHTLASGVRDKVAEMQHAAGQAAKLTGRLLALARNATSPLHAIDVGREARDLLPLLKSLAGATVCVTLEAPVAPLCALLRRGHVEQILINLVTNGRDAITGDGWIHLRVGRETVDGRRRVVLAATDSGAGMSPAVKARVGELFFTSKHGRGTGLGMASVRGILAETKGELRIDSRPGEGSTVALSWPEVETAVAAATPLPPLVLPRAGSATLLLVEDDDLVRGVTRRTLEAAGYRVLAAATPAAAKQLAQECAGGVDLLLTDVVMPGQSGPQLAAELRAERPELRVAFLSGYVDDAHDAQMPAGVAVLSKPFSAQELLAFVQRGLADPASDPAVTSP